MVKSLSFDYGTGGLRFEFQLLGRHQCLVFTLLLDTLRFICLLQFYSFENCILECFYLVLIYYH